jgi:hypothetical protein
MYSHTLRSLRCWIMAGLISMCILVGCNAQSSSATVAQSTGQPVIAPTATAQPATPTPPVGTALPKFSDWRAAYAVQTPGARFAMLHVVTLDGKTDITGPVLSYFAPGDTDPVGSFSKSAGIAPDGHTLAYEGGDIAVIDLASGATTPRMTAIHFYAQQMVWSPDGRYVAMGDLAGNYWLLRASDGTITTMPGSPFPATVTPNPNLLGWLDATHVILGFYDQATVHSSGGSPLGLFSLDITTGTHYRIAEVPIGNNEVAPFLSPDGKKVIIYSFYSNGLPYIPFAAVVDTATGAITPLPGVAAHMRAGFSGTPEWRPGTSLIAVSTGYTVNHDLQDWLLDYQNDTLIPIAGYGYPAGWSPDGTTLAILSEDGLVDNAPLITITALAFNGNQEVHQTVLTTQATSFGIYQPFTFWGFVRTAGG